MLRAVAISVIIGTFLIGMYYVVASSYVQPERQDKLQSALNELESGMTYEKFVSLDEQKRQFIVKQMPSGTLELLQQESRAHPTFIAEKPDDIRTKSGSNEIQLVKITQISGLKGYLAAGEASVVASGDMAFLRLEEFGVTSGIDQHVYLTKDGTIAESVDLGPLKASQGDQYYDVTGADIATYSILVIYSPTFDTYYAHAQFPKNQ